MEAIKFGEYIRAKRKEKKLSIKKLSELSGVSHPYISQIENGVRGVPKPEMIKKLSKGLEIPYGDLMREAGYFLVDVEPSTFGQSLQLIRIHKGLSVEEISEKSSYSVMEIRKIEDEQSFPGYSVIKELLNIYEVSLNDYIILASEVEGEIKKDEFNYSYINNLVSDITNKKAPQELDIHKLFIENDNTLVTNFAIIPLLLTYKGRALTDEDLEDIKQLLKIKFKD